MSAAAPGPLAEEAARLVEALGTWARDAAGGATTGAGTGAECQVCPFCQALALLRRTQPETFGHLTEASASLMAALRTVVDSREREASHSSRVEHIDLDGEQA